MVPCGKPSQIWNWVSDKRQKWMENAIKFRQAPKIRGKIQFNRICFAQVSLSSLIPDQDHSWIVPASPRIRVPISAVEQCFTLGIVRWYHHDWFKCNDSFFSFLFLQIESRWQWQGPGTCRSHFGNRVVHDSWKSRVELPTSNFSPQNAEGEYKQIKDLSATYSSVRT